MKEASLYLPLTEGANTEGWMLRKEADGSPGRKPFDIWGMTPLGHFVACEVKVADRTLRPDDPIPWAKFEVQQKPWLKRVAMAQDALALVALYEEPSKEMHVFCLWDDLVLDDPLKDLYWVALSREGGVFRGWWHGLEGDQEPPERFRHPGLDIGGEIVYTHRRR